jgi:hypothetical protein
MNILKKWLARRWGMVTPEDHQKAQDLLHWRIIAALGDAERWKAQATALQTKCDQLTIALFNANSKAQRRP